MLVRGASDLPLAMNNIAIVQNPRNLNEIISFGSALNDQGFIYDTETDSYKRFDFKFDFKKYCDTKIDYIDVDPIIPHRIDTDDSNIILLGSFGSSFQFYCVFDTINDGLKPIINENNNNKNKYYCLSTDTESDPSQKDKYEIIANENICNYENLSFHSFGSRSIIFKNQWLFVSGGSNNDSSNVYMLTVFKIDASNNNYSPKLISKIDLNNDYLDHGMVLYKHKKNENGTNKIDIIVFGGPCVSFIKSFVKITFEFNKDYTKLIYDNNGNVSYTLVANPIEWLTHHEIKSLYPKKTHFVYRHHRTWFLDADRWPNVCKLCMDRFVCHFLFNRYLIIIGGSHIEFWKRYCCGTVNTFKCFDFQRKEWRIFIFKYANDIDKKKYKMHDPIPELEYGNPGSLFLKSIEKIYVMGGRRTENIEGMKHNFYFDFDFFKWRYERLIWIGYEKNIDNKSCLLALLPKEVIKLILKFLKTTFLDYLIKCV